MKKIFSILLASFLFISFQTKAQVSVSFGPEIGGTLSGIYSDEDDLLAGVNGHVGAATHVQFGRFFAVRPVVFYKFGTYVNSDDTELKLSLSRVGINLPVLFSYNFNNDGKIFVGAGPSLTYAISGKTKYYGESEKIKFGNSADDDIKPLDFGLHVKAGYQFGMGLSLGLSFNTGFTNLSNDSYTKVNTLDAIGISIGWMFGGKGNND